jgi:hypothetical protein
MRKNPKMNEKTEISLALAKAFMDQGHEDMARSIITKLIQDGLEDN